MLSRAYASILLTCFDDMFSKFVRQNADVWSLPLLYATFWIKGFRNDNYNSRLNPSCSSWLGLMEIQFMQSILLIILYLGKKFPYSFCFHLPHFSQESYANIFNFTLLRVITICKISALVFDTWFLVKIVVSTIDSRKFQDRYETLFSYVA